MEPVHIRDGVALLASQIQDLRWDVPAIETNTGHLVALAVAARLVASLNDLPVMFAPLLPSEVQVARKCVCEALRVLTKTSGDTQVLCLVLDSGVDLKPLMLDDPNAADSDEQLRKVLHEEGLWCVGVPRNPKYEAGLKAALARGDSSDALLKWAELEVPQQELNLSTGLAHHTLLVLLQQCRNTNYSRLIEKFHTLLERVTDQDAQQVAMMFALQRFCFDNGWPESVMEDVLPALYLHDVLTEEAFEAWRAADGTFWDKRAALDRIGAFQEFLKNAKEEE